MVTNRARLSVESYRSEEALLLFAKKLGTGHRVEIPINTLMTRQSLI